MNGVDGRKPIDGRRFPAALIVVYCLPMVLIPGGLLIAGGTRLGLLIPAITIGAMIGVMLFIGRLDKAPPK